MCAAEDCHRRMGPHFEGGPDTGGLQGRPSSNARQCGCVLCISQTLPLPSSLSQAFLMDSGGMLPLGEQPCVLLPPVLSEVPPLAVCCSLCGESPNNGPSSFVSTSGATPILPC